MAYSNLTLTSQEIITITPAMATEMLNGNAANRPLSKNRVKAFSKLIKDGDFRTTHQGIALNGSGAVVDGQHRLYAIIDAGIPVRMVVAHYAEDCTALGLPCDIGEVRPACVILGKDRRTIETFQFIVRELGATKIIGKAMTDTGKIFDKHPGIVEWYENNISKNKCNVISTAPIRAAVVMAYISGYDWSEQYRAIVSYDYEEMESTTMALHKRLLTEKGATASPRFRHMAFGATYAAATTMGQIKVFKDATINAAWEKAKEVYAKYMKEE